MNKEYSFSNDQMNGIVEDTYANIIREFYFVIYKAKLFSYLAKNVKNGEMI